MGRRREVEGAELAPGLDHRVARLVNARRHIVERQVWDSQELVVQLASTSFTLSSRALIRSPVCLISSKR